MASLRRPGAFMAIILLLPAAASAQAAWSDLDPATQIALAVQAAPDDLRDGATVHGYDATGNLVTLREGTGELICLAPNPTSDAFEVSCHHESLEPFFARGRELLEQGLTAQERVQKRWDEYTAGALPIPYGAINHILQGTGYDPVTGEVTEPYLRWTIYTPNATPGGTGIGLMPSAGAPWLMFPGTPGSHIMITPPRPGGGG